ncbi:MAG: PhnD/SsuA/transferrin family substrate-binding protein [Gammaproteobacteria bacterium]|nr:PhnD/SsuA/transferrin family substrate-binding protein [Gammaproteobacteria bacterium]MDH3411772.1 PhnD/SsuA/transferrin family substrate-binding protein [Gammaproteobacteria bacterium]
MASVANLPMYDLPELRAQTDALWQRLAVAMRDAGVKDVPDSLSRQEPCHSIWCRRDLIFSQTCGYPMMHEYKSVLRPLATPRYSAPGCRGSEYVSAVLVRANAEHEDIAALRGAVCAVNSPVSQSGYNALRALIAPLAKNARFFSDVRVTGSHPGSIESVAAGQADVCAVDCVTHALLMRYRPSALAATRVLTYTPRSPGLPFVTRTDLGEDQFRRLRSSVHEALTDPADINTRSALLIEGVENLELDDYAIVCDMEVQAAAYGYTVLA